MTVETTEPLGLTLLLCPFLKHGGQADGGGVLARSPESQREEAVGLAESIELELCEALSVPLGKLNPSTYFGSGKVNELAERIVADDIALLIVDAALSPVQQRNLERGLKCKVIDRTQLILEIFGERARTREGTLQVELAALMYQKSRLVRSWTHLERQRGGAGFTGGPGERQIELDRRIIQDRITVLKKQLESVQRTRTLHRKQRRTVPYPVVALVGYTNAGKSTLFNRLTGAKVHAEDQLFATLDPTLRRVDLPCGLPIMLSDTVGFISNLPTMLVAAFRATLEEVLEADIIIHMRDIAHPDTNQQRHDVLQVLGELGVEAERSNRAIEVWNKADLLDEEAHAFLQEQSERDAAHVLLSAVTGDGVKALVAAVETTLLETYLHQEVVLDAADGRSYAWLRANAFVQQETREDMQLTLSLLITEENWAKFQANYKRTSA